MSLHPMRFVRPCPHYIRPVSLRTRFGLMVGERWCMCYLPAEGESASANPDPRGYLGSLCQTCGDGVYIMTEQGMECDHCAGLAGIRGALPPIPRHRGGQR